MSSPSHAESSSSSPSPSPSSSGPAEAPGRTLVIAGPSGVVGQHLIRVARVEGYALRVLTRAGGSPGGVRQTTRWDPQAAARGDEQALATIAAALDGADLLVNLAGASLAEGRLNTAHKRRILESRMDATRALVAAQARCERPPSCWINASAVGYYGETGEADVTEASPRGAGFLAAVCERWEEAALEAESPRTRVILARMGLVLARDAPAWKTMERLLRFGLGGALGSGLQWWAWIDADDLARTFLFLHRSPGARGPYNLTTADPVRQGDLVRDAALVVGRPAFLPSPAALLRLAVGEVADVLLLPSCRALPRRLEALGFEFERPCIGRELLTLLDGPA